MALAGGVLALVGSVVWRLIHIPWRDVIFGAAIALGVGVFILGTYWVSQRGPTWEVSRVVGAWVAAKRGKYCPEIEFVEEE